MLSVAELVHSSSQSNFTIHNWIKAGILHKSLMYEITILWSDSGVRFFFFFLWYRYPKYQIVMNSCNLSFKVLKNRDWNYSSDLCKEILHPLHSSLEIFRKKEGGNWISWRCFLKCCFLNFWKDRKTENVGGSSLHWNSKYCHLKVFVFLCFVE